jgi:hypothetical protein
MRKLDISHLGPIAGGSVELGDLTLIVGPQATGKSVLLQTLKLLKDHSLTVNTLRRHGFEWKQGGEGNETFLQLFFGEGMGHVWHKDTVVKVDGKSVSLDSISGTNRKSVAESVFYIPAQRVLTLRNGYPLPFVDWKPFDPYVLRSFSDSLSRLMQFVPKNDSDLIFPQVGRLRKAVQEKLDEGIFRGAEVRLKTDWYRMEIILSVNGAELPFMTWSAGQREFIPLLMGLYWLMPTSGGQRKHVEWVIVEEPEMGLHPRAIQSFLLAVFELMARGYKVVISTHSPVVLEAVWALRVLQGRKGFASAMSDLFSMKDSAQTRAVFDVLNGKEFRTFYFKTKGKDGATIEDISALDPFSEADGMADWGGLTGFASRANEVVAKAVSHDF